MDGGEAKLVLRVHVRLVAGVLEQQLDDVLLGVEAGRVEGRGQKLLVDMPSTSSCLRVEYGLKISCLKDDVLSITLRQASTKGVASKSSSSMARCRMVL